jgi:predicted transcriptional regulator
MSARGYSVLLLRDIREANPHMLGVRLAKLCVGKSIPVSDVAAFFGVSRVTVYAWFRGQVEVSEKHAGKMHELLDKLS